MPKFSDIIGFTASRLHGFTASRLHGYCHILLAYHKNNSYTRITRINKNFLLRRVFCEGVFFCRDDLLLKYCELLYETCCYSLIYSVIHKNFINNFILWRTVIYYGSQEFCQETLS